MVWRRCDAFNAPCFCQLGEQSGQELAASVGGDGGRDSKMLYPAIGEGINDTFGGHVDDWDGNRPTGKTINRCQQISEAI